MTDAEQRRYIDEHHFKEGHGRPFELKIRDVARQAVEDPFCYVNGVLVAFMLTGRSGFTDVAIRLVPELRGDPDLAQLIAERIIRKEVL